MTPKTISLETADREGWSLARSLVEFFSAEPFLGFPIVQRWAEEEGIDLGPRSPESVHRGKSWARHFVTRRGNARLYYHDAPKMTVMGCVTNPAAHPTYHLDSLAIKFAVWNRK